MAKIHIYDQPITIKGNELTANEYLSFKSRLSHLLACYFEDSNDLLYEILANYESTLSDTDRATLDYAIICKNEEIFNRFDH